MASHPCARSQTSHPDCAALLSRSLGRRNCRYARYPHRNGTLPLEPCPRKFARAVERRTMTGISHKLAQRYLRMALDGLLSPTQHLDLETHLRDCEACRRDAESLSSLTTRLHTEFQSRWDDHDGPSKQVLINIQSQTRRIMMQKRVDFVFNILGSAAVLLILFFVVSAVVAQLQKKSAASNGNQTATPAPLSQGKLIAFVSKQTGNNDIYTMNSDGSDVINLTNNSADDNWPVW